MPQRKCAIGTTVGNRRVIPAGIYWLVEPN